MKITTRHSKLFSLTSAAAMLIGLAAPAQPGLAAAPQPPAQSQQVTRDADGRALVQDTTPLRANVANAGAACALPAPTLLTPAQGSTSKDLQYPKFTWSAVAGGQGYVVQIADNSAFTSTLASVKTTDFITESVISYWSLVYLNELKTYYWRAATICSDGSFGPFAPPLSFTTISYSGTPPPVCQLPAPAPISPAPGSTISTLIPKLRFATVPNGNVYAIMFGVNAATFPFIEPKRFRVGVRPDLEPEAAYEFFSDNLNPATTYYWAVSTGCADVDTYGAFSQPISFTTPITSVLPPAPVQIAPVDGINAGSIRVIFGFTAVPTATRYQVIAELDNSIFYFASTTPQVDTVLQPNQSYSWRVRSGTDAGWGEASSYRSIHTPVSSASADVTPSTGITLAPSTSLRLQFPPDAVADNTTIRYNLLEAPTQATGSLKFGNRAFTLDAVSNGITITNFLKPYTLTVSYDVAELAVLGISDPAKLNLYFWDATAGQWKGVLPCAGCGVNTSTKTLTAVLDHFTEFMLAAPSSDTATRYFVYLPLALR